LDYHPGSRSANPKPCPCSTEEQLKKKLAHQPKLSQRRTALLVEFPELITTPIFPVTGTLERHERPFTCILAVILDAAVAEGMLKVWWRGPKLQGIFRPLRHCLRSPYRLVGEHSAESRAGRKTSKLPELHFLPMSSPLSCEDAESLMSQLKSLKPSENRTVETCNIYLPYDGFAVNGVQGCCQWSPAPEHHICAG
ncbi:hypothetical protein N7447_007484, partial [Penicillium robsamsonii]|uniref:uncharacterized protein n=1 Tax=Penicillium robsamsonii TaxID=1792511 RepID=UPI0025487342